MAAIKITGIRRWEGLVIGFFYSLVMLQAKKVQIMSVKWIKNESEQRPREIEVGDLVHLKFEDYFCYLAKCVVQEVSGSKITVLVDEVFDWDTKGLIGNTLGGTIEKIRGSTVTIESSYIYVPFKTDEK